MLLRCGDYCRLLPVLDGMSREAAAEIGAMDRQTLRDWVHRFNEKSCRRGIAVGHHDMVTDRSA
jgi:hypothetical protein